MRPDNSHRTVIFDFDGTISDPRHRRHLIAGPHKNWPEFTRLSIEDPPHPLVIQNLIAFSLQGFRVEIWSGRTDTVAHESLAWLGDYGIGVEKFNGLRVAVQPEGILVEVQHLRMRSATDFRPDEVLKESWLDEFCQKSGHLPHLVIDDRDKVVAMWRRRGLACVQVRDGNF